MTDPGTAVKVHLERAAGGWVPVVVVMFEEAGPGGVQSRYEHRPARHLARPDERSGAAAARGLAGRLGVPCTV